MKNDHAFDTSLRNATEKLGAYEMAVETAKNNVNSLRRDDPEMGAEVEVKLVDEVSEGHDQLIKSINANRIQVMVKALAELERQ